MDTQATEYERRDATEDDVKTLPHVVDSIPLAVWIALVAGALEGFTLVEPDSQARWKRLLPGHIYRRDISVAKRFGLRVDNTAMDS
ncbi:unnamed protein product [Penicillium crustosum]